MTRLLLLILVLPYFLFGCSCQSGISEDEAVDIASSWIPPDILLRANVDAYFDSERGVKGIWQVYFQRLGVTRVELEEFGWEEGDNTSFGDLPGDLNEYYGVLINVDAKTGDILSKGAGIWFGPGPSVASPS